MPLVEHRNVSGHAQQVASGDMVGIEAMGQLDPKDPHDSALIASGAFIPTDEGDADLTGEALKARAQELDIEGRSTMNADELRAAIAAAEAAPSGEDE